MAALRIEPHELIPKPGARQRIREAERAAAERRVRRIPITVDHWTDDECMAVAVLTLATWALLGKNAKAHATALADLEARRLRDDPTAAPGDKTGLILAEICDKHRVTVEDLRGERRTRSVSYARQEAYYRLYHERRALSLKQIGNVLCKDHTSVVHGIRAHALRAGLSVDWRMA